MYLPPRQEGTPTQQVAAFISATWQVVLAELGIRGGWERGGRGCSGAGGGSAAVSPRSQQRVEVGLGPGNMLDPNPCPSGGTWQSLPAHILVLCHLQK